MPGPFRTREALLLLALGALVVAGVLLLLDAGWTWTLAAVFVWAGIIFPRLGNRLQESLFERALSRARYDDALRLAVAMRNGAVNPTLRELAAFDVGLVHLARGAPSDAERVFSRLDRRRLRERTRLVAGTYHALARVRARDEGEAQQQAARELVAVAGEALEKIDEDANVLAARAEGYLALNQLDEAWAALRRSLELEADPRDPSPGERHLLLGRIAAARGDTTTARQAWQVAASLDTPTPFVHQALVLLQEAS